MIKNWSEVVEVAEIVVELETGKSAANVAVVTAWLKILFGVAIQPFTAD